MRWKGRRQSDNVEDRRGQGGGGGLPFPLPMGRGASRGGGGGFGLIGIIVIIGIMIFFPNFGKMILGGGGLPLPGGGGGGVSLPKMELPQTRETGRGGPFDPSRRASQPRGGLEDKPGGTRKQAPSDEMRKFLSVVLADTEDVWNNIFNQLGRRYKEPKMVMFSGYTQTACGTGMRQMGPFYCPLDQHVYIDTAFYDELHRKFGASGDFAQAYVIAHEVGHHVQTLLGITNKVQKYKARYGQKSKASNAVQVRMELQADCFAGVWAKRADRAKDILERGDLEEAMNAANAIGDDKIQKRTRGYVVPDSFTHGSSRQRMRWFQGGYQQGDISACDTFSTDDL